MKLDFLIMSLLPKIAFQKNAELYKVLANAIRLEVLNLLRSQERSLEELTKIVGVRKANVSQHLSLLKSMKLVVSERRGIHVYYRLTDPRIVSPCKILHKLRERNVCV
jgi:DNA-binding transcriptional ArsR family regulator